MKVVLGIPVVDGVPGEVYASHMMLAVTLGRKVDVIMPSIVNVFPHCEARNEIMKRALMHEGDYLLFVDSDTEVPMNTFALLLDALISNKAVMTAGHYRKRGYPYTTVWFKTKDDVIYICDAEREAEPAEISGCGLGCNLIDLNWVRENLESPWFYQGYIDGRKVHEDTGFCESILKKGGKIFAVPSVRCGHLSARVMVNDKSANGLRAQGLEDIAKGENVVEVKREENAVSLPSR